MTIGGRMTTGGLLIGGVMITGGLTTGGNTGGSTGSGTLVVDVLVPKSETNPTTDYPLSSKKVYIPVISLNLVIDKRASTNKLS